ncbi:mCG145818, partial [Mus musculus]
ATAHLPPATAVIAAAAKVEAEAVTPRGLESMPGWMNGKAGSGESGGASRAQRRPTAAVPGLNRKGPSCPCPARAPAGTTAAAARLRGTRRTCPFRCGSLCLARRGFWIAGFIPTRLGSSPLTFPSCSRLATSLLS